MNEVQASAYWNQCILPIVPLRNWQIQVLWRNLVSPTARKGSVAGFPLLPLVARGDHHPRRDIPSVAR